MTFYVWKLDLHLQHELVNINYLMSLVSVVDKLIELLHFFKNYCIKKVWKENLRKNIFKLLQEYLLARCVLQSCHLKKGNAALTCLIARVKERQMVEFNLNILMSTTAACLCNHFKIDRCSQTAAENTLTSYCEVFAKYLKSKQ